MTDKERRLHRALIKLAVAHRLIDEAASDVAAAMPGSADTCDRLTGRVKWMTAQIKRELERGEG